MTTKARKNDMNLALKIAILKSGYTAGAISMRARIREVRLSKIIHNRAVATEQEQKALAKALGTEMSELFADSIAS